MSNRTLPSRPKELEAYGLVERAAILQTPVRVKHRLTEKGRTLQDVLESTAARSREWIGPAGHEPVA